MKVWNEEAGPMRAQPGHISCLLQRQRASSCHLLYSDQRGGHQARTEAGNFRLREIEFLHLETRLILSGHSAQQTLELIS